jgi:hypothetical protein
MLWYGQGWSLFFVAGFGCVFGRYKNDFIRAWVVDRKANADATANTTASANATATAGPSTAPSAQCANGSLRMTILGMRL